MELVAIDCPKCKGTLHVDKDLEEIFCMYCRTEIQVKPPSTGDAGVNHEFKSRMAIADHLEDLYFKGEKSFNEVMSAYDDAKKVGAHHSEYWLARGRFYAKGTLNEFSIGNIQLEEQQEIIKQYELLMDTALKRDDVKKVEVEAEKNEIIAKINEVFDKRRLEEEEKRKEEEAIKEQKRIEKEALRKQREEERKQIKAQKAETFRKKRPFIITAVIVIFAIIVIGSVHASLMRQQEEEARHQANQARSLARWERILTNIKDEDWKPEDTPYNRFLEMGYLIDFITSTPTRNDILNMEIELDESRGDSRTLLSRARNTRTGMSSLHFMFRNDNYNEFSRLAMYDIQYFDGLALYQLHVYSMSDIAGVFSINYGVEVISTDPPLETIEFIYEGVSFQIHSFSSFGATIWVNLEW